MRIRADLAAAADPTRAPGMQAYMKSAMPYRGVKMPEVRAICKRAFAENGPSTFDDWQSAVLELWRGAKFREERYVAMELAGQKRFATYRTPDAIPMLEEMIVTGAWWDHVDEAAHLIGDMQRRLLQQYAQGLKDGMGQLSSEDLAGVREMVQDLNEMIEASVANPGTS